jgi:hypothetical protein
MYSLSIHLRIDPHTTVHNKQGIPLEITKAEPVMDVIA